MTQKELSDALNELTAKLEKHGYHYLIVAGKDGTCSRHYRSTYEDMHGMLQGFSENQPIINGLIQHVADKLRRADT